ncbi:MAG TPA: alpha-(1-_3)-arabinofuranosyltransferase family protein [Motilibacteraceae bacterium]|nr:alpha-(1->3)-arabinofuranosyltransferase family protein [Motilibacteraceae bacterium]
MTSGPAVLERARQAPEPPRRAVQRTQRVHAMRRTALLLALVAVAFVQQPGQIVPDTKLDLSVAPGRFLAGAWHLWDPTTAMGSLRNQAYGYLWPMAPFFALGHALGLPAWVVQRAWWALLLVLAAAGTERLAARLGIGTPSTRLIAAASYALSARTVSEVGAVSAEVWPLALAPWVLLPLVTGAQGGSERRAAARSGLALACVGGVNAAATLMTLPLAAWWLLTRAPGPRRRRLAAWWSLAVLLATTWWVVPLLLLGRFSPPFLDWIESAAVTTSQASAANALRGVTHWVPYLASAGGPQWPAGWDLLTVRTLVLAGGLLAAVGVAGLAWRGLPERGFLVGGALVGLVLLTAGHVGAGAGPFAAPVAHLLDGPLAAFRNTHKADPVLRLPLALGLAHLLAAVRLRPVRQLPLARHAVPALGALAVLAAAAPALVGALPQPGAFAAVPGYWRQTADWLDGQPGQGRVLVLPGAMASAYGWGAPRDDVLQPLLDRPWAERDGVPLGTAGAIRVLDAVETRLGSGEGSVGLAPFLARAGIEFVVLRNDLDWVGTGAPEPLLVHQTLARSRGLHRVAGFGPVVGGTQLPDTYVDRGLDLPYPAVEVWRVLPYRGPAELRQAGQLLDVVGGPEDLLTLEDTGMLGQRASVLAGDPLPAGLTPGGAVLTDGYRRREVDFGSVRDNVSSTLTADQPFLADRAAHDYDLSPPRARTVIRFEGATSASASSSAADASALVGRNPAYRPDAAFDGDPATSWRSGGFRPAVGQWVQLDLGTARALADVQVTVPEDPAVADASRVLVTTDTGRAQTDLAARGSTTTLAVPPGPTRHLRVTVTAVRSGGQAGFAEITVPGVQVRRVVVAPTPSATAIAPRTVVLRVPPGARGGCAFAGRRPLCAQGLARPGEQTSIDDDVALAAGSYDVSATAVSRPGPALDALLQPVGPALSASASSTLVPDPADRPQTVVDRDLGTGWTASAADAAPTLTLTLPEPRRLTGLQLLVDPALAASRPAAVQVSVGGRSSTEPVDAEGYVRFRPVTAQQVRLRFTAVDPRWSLSTSGVRSRLPVGVSEIRLLGADDLRRGVDPSARVEIPCGYAPPLTVDGRALPTRAGGRLGDLLTGAPLRLTTCTGGPLRLAAGGHRVTLAPSGELAPRSLTLRPAAPPAGEAPSVVPRLVAWGPEHRTVQVPAADVARVLTVHENANDGWRAALGGRALAPVRIDGWQQGWLVPAGASGVVTLDYGPARPYRAGLVVGGLLVLTLLALALLPARAAPARPAARALQRPIAAPVVAAVVLVLAFGWTGLLALAVASAVLALVRGRGPGAGALAAGIAAAGAAALAAARPWPSAAPGASGWPAQLLALAAVACALLVGLPGRRSFRRRKGRSTR